MRTRVRGPQGRLARTRADLQHLGRAEVLLNERPRQ
ncbi:hypothetical protein ACVWXB_007390 [Streptomyces sp. TE12347]